MDMTVHRGVRWSTAKAHLVPAMKRPNLTVMPHTRVLRVLFDGTRAVGEQERGAAVVGVLGYPPAHGDMPVAPADMAVKHDLSLCSSSCPP